MLAYDNSASIIEENLMSRMLSKPKSLAFEETILKLVLVLGACPKTNRGLWFAFFPTLFDSIEPCFDFSLVLKKLFLS